MQNPNSYIDDINRFLSKNGATVFGNDNWRLLINRDHSGIGPVPTMILAPTDAAIANLIDLSNQSWDEIFQSPEGRDILENHISLLPTQKHWPMFTAVNGRRYGSNQADLEALQPSASTVIQVSNFVNIVVIVIGKVIVHNDQLARLKTSKVGYSIWQRANPESVQAEVPATELRGDEIPRMGRDIFRLMVTEKNLRGRDLLALCTGNKEIATLCDRDDQVLFRQLLKQEFNFDYGRGFARESPRQLYAKLHRFRVEAYIRFNVDRADDQLILDFNHSVIKNNEDKPSTVLGKDVVKRSRLVTLPLEGEFERYLISRYTVNIICVYEAPESATLIHPLPNDDWDEPKVEYVKSNDWIFKYFNGRSFRVNDPDFIGSYSIDSFILNMLRAEFNRVAMTGEMQDGSKFTIIFARLYRGYELY